VGDYVKFKEVEGMTEINNIEPAEVVRVTGPHSFKIQLDKRQYGSYTR
jgi:hypothetical protein